MNLKLDVVRLTNEDVIATSCDHDVKHYYKVKISDTTYYYECIYENTWAGLLWNQYPVTDQETKNKLTGIEYLEYLGPGNYDNVYYFKNGTITKCESNHNINVG